MLPAVDPVYAKVELTTIRAMVAAVVPKNPKNWDRTQAMLDEMLASLERP